MCAWRYNPMIDSFELSGYYHRKGSFEPPSQPLCKVASKDTFVFDLIFDKDNKQATIKIRTNKGVFSDSKEFYEFSLSRRINTWFGGNKAAPQDMIINFSQI